MADDAHKTIDVRNGPHSILPATRRPEASGRATVANVERLRIQPAPRFGATAENQHSNTFVSRHQALMHIGHICACESLRHHTFTAQAAFASISGLGIDHGDRHPISGPAARIGAPTDPTDIMAQA
ncbi:3-dehydroquinate dehydratase (3-dehydroquinase) (Type II DHQase) [Bradyrhizobium sp. ORS 375]|uniref:3-dehydroquinate dehydratase (3-dehydroquinase) (type II DHQase) n=1 Tax=Bradyrhizobium sp. (strain ORS 375) TaxID=566679 RepID=UPI0002409B86|nr:3-dehydroquinate dehydratase (3-dehydroquinase) (type II DHQase) [Bradyrhizobium sp. ORS 375]CCD91628.1 3-dehydroquinate dehydratase (3-dehydroquinase) (Type II DHQase) [Bradyrhizobium sp. ORS 375]